MATVNKDFKVKNNISLANTADTSTTATHYFVETATDGIIRPKTLANVRSEIVTTAAVNAAAATTVGTITSGTWQGSSISTTYTDAKVTSVNGSTGAVTGLATTAGKLSQFSATTSAELAGVISDETGSGALVFANSPVFTTPNIGVATGTSFNSITGLSSTTPLMNGTAAIGTATTTARADHIHPSDTSKTNYVNQSGAGFDFNNAIPSSSTIYRVIWNTGDANMLNSPNGNSSGFLFASQGSHDKWNGQFFLEQGSSNNFWIRGSSDSAGTRVWGSWRSVALTSGKLSQFSSTTSAELAGVISDETGSGALVFATSPALVTPNIGAANGASLTLTGALTATTKSFDIEHPTKENMRLRYGSLEGPENGVYARGRSNSSTIALPDYWTGLVDEDSITVQLTPVGKKQDLFVEDIADNTVKIGGIEGEYFYLILAERKDVERLVVEY